MLKTPFLDRGLGGLLPAERFQRRAYRIFLLLSLTFCALLVPVNLLVKLFPSAFLSGLALVFLLGMLVFELRTQRKGSRRTGEIISFALTVSSIVAITFAETPSKSVSFFFLVLPLQAALLVQGIRLGGRWLALAVAEYLATVIAEALLSPPGRPLEFLGDTSARVLFLLAFYLIAAEVRKPLDAAKTDADLGAARLKETNLALERALRARSEFLANMSHEIRTPLNAVIGSTELLLNSPMEGEQREFVQTIRDSGKGLLVILNDILDLARLESGKMLVERIPFPLRPLLFDALDLIAMRAEEQGIELIGEVTIDVPTTLDGDPVRLRQILLNLLGNAIKFTSQGQVILKASISREHRPRLRIAIEDSGIGLSPEGLARLFQPFHQNDATIHRVHGGTGLGLAICRRLVLLLGGQIGAESKLGVGSTFWIELPLANTSTESSSRAPWLANKTVLVIDPNPHLRKALGVLLGAHFIRSWEESSSMEDALGLEFSAERPSPALVLVGEPFEKNTKDLLLLQEKIPDAKFLLMLPLGAADVSVPPPFHGILSKPVRPERLQRSLLALHGPVLVSPSGATTSRRTGARILLVEDNPVNQRILSRMIQKLGHTCEIAPSGEDALEVSANNSFDLVLMDMRLPGIDGPETTLRMRQREGADRHTIIVAVTANAFSEDRERCLASGMDDFLAKPVRIEDLQAMLTRWLKRPASGRHALGVTAR